MSDTLPKKPKGRRLSIKQQKFAKHLINLGEPIEAVIQAGYKAGNRQRASEIASQLVRKPNVGQYIDYLMEKKHPDHEMRIMDLMMESVDKLRLEPKVSPETIKMLELYAKMKGLFAPQKTESTQHRLTLNLPGEAPAKSVEVLSSYPAPEKEEE